MSSGLVFVYTTLPNHAAAQELAVALVEAKLAACVNIYPPMTSVYAWEGKIEVAAEVACFIKTRETLTKPVMDEVRRRHPYQVPAMLVLPIQDGNDDYLSWARDRTRA